MFHKLFLNEVFDFSNIMIFLSFRVFLLLKNCFLLIEKIWIFFVVGEILILLKKITLPGQ